MKKVIVAPLDWGLGHATRCIPIIKAIQKKGFVPVIASDGAALKFLNKEFPNTEYFELPEYHIKYGRNLKMSLFKQFPRLLRVIKSEHELIRTYIDNNPEVIGIISDNRPGIRSKKIPSVYITHQLNVLSGMTTFFTTFVHQKMIKKFDECWIPDNKDSMLSGKLSKVNSFPIPLKYIGGLSRFKSKNIAFKNTILIILSGPEPQRTILEKKLLTVFKHYNGKVTLVRGVIEQKQRKIHHKNIEIINFLLSKELEQKLYEAELVVCRSGYSSVMDLAKLGKKVLFIPTKGQSEQEYLASHLEKKGIAPFISEDRFELKILEKTKLYSGFKPAEGDFNSDLLHLFEGERKS